MTEKKDWHTATLGDKATIRDAIKKLSASSLQIILVIEENNSLLGTITDGDIRRAILRGSTLDGNLQDLMNKDPLVVSSDITKDSVLHLMNHNGLNAIPIVDKKRHVLGLHLINEMIVPEAKNNLMIIVSIVPLETMFGYSTDMRSLSKGRASFSMEPSHFDQVPASLLQNIVETSARKPARK
mgnify:CR=1 FL=1